MGHIFHMTIQNHVFDGFSVSKTLNFLDMACMRTYLVKEHVPLFGKYLTGDRVGTHTLNFQLVNKLLDSLQLL